MAAPITLATSISATPDKVFQALSTSAGLAAFWTPDSKADPQIGSVAVFGFGPTKLEMRVDELNPSRRVTWTCMSDFSMEPHCWRGTTVSWELAEEDNGQTSILLEHGNWPDTLAQQKVASTACNWALILRALKVYAETGKAEPVFGLRPVGA